MKREDFVGQNLYICRSGHQERKTVKVRRRLVIVSIVLCVVALFGLVGLQVYLLQIAFTQKEEAFRRTVTTALASIVVRLESGEAVATAFGEDTTGVRKNKAYVNVNLDTSNIPGEKGKTVEAASPFVVSGNRVLYSVSTPQQVTVKVFDLLGREDTMIVDTLKRVGEHIPLLDSTKYGKGQFVYSYATDSTTMMVRVVNGLPGSMVTSGPTGLRKLNMVRGVFDRMLLREHQPIERRLNPALLDSAVAVGLKEAGLTLPYAYAVSGESADSLRFVSAREYQPDLKSSPFRMRLFPGDMFAPQNQLVLFFPHRAAFLLTEVAPLFGLTVLFVLVILFFFVVAVRTIFRQKRFAGLMTDFMNNMTHEFKTPISTIQLAGEAIARPDVLTDRKKVLRYNDVILDENARMRRQVEKILQMAVLEEGDFELNLVPLDMHDVIRKAVDNIILQVEAKKGTIDCHLDASACTVSGDPVHASNIIHNLLDNANKYSPDAPHITVTTTDDGGELLIRISDRGIGMKADDVKRVFEKYYRVSSGNVHDVKGFGLGLSYVKLMVTALKGTIGIRSVPGNGTDVDLRFPLHPVQPGTM